MNRSIVITRYAYALVKYVQETGQGDKVCPEAEALESALHTIPDLRRMIMAADDVVSARDKINLLQAALGGKMTPEMDRFLNLLSSNGRLDLVEDILRDFVTVYYRSKGICRAHLITATEPSEHLIQRLKALVKQKTGDDVIIKVDVDPSIIGGFVFDMDTWLMDASVKRQLDIIRNQFVENNRRIV